MEDYIKKLKEARLESGKLMTQKQLTACNGIIHTAAVAGGTAGAIPIPVADAIPITAAQVTMVISLGKTFDVEITESAAKSIIAAAAATFVGRNLVKLIPIAGWVISGVVAAGITEAIGWMAAVDFAKQYRSEYESQKSDEAPEKESKDLKDIVGENYEIIDYIDFSHRTTQSECATELFDEEISASVYQIGAFSFRVARCAYTEYPIIWDDRKPVTAERLQELREQSRSMQREMDSSIWFNHESVMGAERVETVVFACKHTAMSTYQYICHAQEEWHGWCENIRWIGVVKMYGDNPQTVLLVHKSWCGDSRSREYWYILFEDGTVKISEQGE